MSDALPKLGTAAIAIIVLLAIMLGLYALTRFLPNPWRERAQTAIFIVPAIILLLGLVVPAIMNLRYSFDGRDGEWAGLSNYKHIFTDADSRIVLRNSLWWAFFVTVVSTTVGITIARWANGMRGEPIAKAMIFLPTAISLVGAGIIWNFVYSPLDFGLMNSIYQLLPGEQDQLLILQNRNILGIHSSFVPGINSFAIMMVIIWIQAGFATVVLSAALKGVPAELTEAAMIDGATDRQAFWRVVLPNVRGTVITVATTTVITTLKVFDIIQTMGKGGLFDTSTIANEMYTQAFPQGNEGLGSAWAMILFLLVLPIVFVNSWNQRRIREGG